MWIAKPNLANNTGMKSFETAAEAVKYLEQVTGHEMSYVRNPKTKKVTYDWELIEKLWEVK